MSLKLHQTSAPKYTPKPTSSLGLQPLPSKPQSPISLKRGDPSQLGISALAITELNFRDESGRYLEEEESFDLTEDEVERCREAFDVIDRDHKGSITKNELRRALKTMGHKDLRSRDIEKIMEVADKENLGSINFSQFKRIIAAQKQSTPLMNEEETLEAFVAMGGDPSGEGYIEAEQLVKIIKGEFEMTIDIEKILRDFDSDGQPGKVDFDQFRKLLSFTQIPSGR